MLAKIHLIKQLNFHLGVQYNYELHTYANLWLGFTGIAP